MSLRWDITKIDNYKEVCYDDYDAEKETGTLSAVTEALIHYTAFVKVYGITQKNWEDVYKRISLHEKLFGPILMQYKKDHDPDSPNEYRREPQFITAQNVYDHIGLSTNGGADTWTQYKNHALSNFDRDVNAEISRVKEGASV